MGRQRVARCSAPLDWRPRLPAQPCTASKPLAPCRPLQICCDASLVPGEEPAFLAQQPAAAAAQLTPELAAQLVELLKVSRRWGWGRL